MKSFSLSTLLLVVTSVGLAAGQLVTLWQLMASQEEVGRIRAKYGDIRVRNKPGVSVFRFVNRDYGQALPGGVTPDESFRIVVPPKQKFMLHLSDVDGNKYAYPSVKQLVPTESVLLDPERSNFVVSRRVLLAGGAPRIVVSTESRAIFDYVAPDWSTGWKSTMESWPDVQMLGQTDFEQNATVRLCWWSPTNGNRGFMLWLEPHEQWLKRQTK